MGTSVVYVLDGSVCVCVCVRGGGGGGEISVRLYHIGVAFCLLLSMNISRTPQISLMCSIHYKNALNHAEWANT